MSFFNLLTRNKSIINYKLLSLVLLLISMDSTLKPIENQLKKSAKSFYFFAVSELTIAKISMGMTRIEGVPVIIKEF